MYKNVKYRIHGPVISSAVIAVTAYREMFAEKRKANRKSSNSRYINNALARCVVVIGEIPLFRINFTERMLTLCLTAFRPVRMISCRSSHVHN